MTILELRNYRLQTITGIASGEKSIKEGLAVEKQCYFSSGEKAYYVIAYLKYNKKEEDVEMEIIGTRILDVQEDEFSLFKKLAIVGKDMVRAANEEDY